MGGGPPIGSKWSPRVDFWASVCVCACACACVSLPGRRGRAPRACECWRARACLLGMQQTATTGTTHRDLLRLSVLFRWLEGTHGMKPRFSLGWRRPWSASPSAVSPPPSQYSSHTLSPSAGGRAGYGVSTTSPIPKAQMRPPALLLVAAKERNERRGSGRYVVSNAERTRMVSWPARCRRAPTCPATSHEQQCRPRGSLVSQSMLSRHQENWVTGVFRAEPQPSRSRNPVSDGGPSSGVGPFPSSPQDGLVVSKPDAVPLCRTTGPMYLGYRYLFVWRRERESVCVHICQRLRERRSGE